MDSLAKHSGPEQSPSLSTAQSVLRTTQLLYPVILLLTFILSAGIHTIVTSKTEEQLVSTTVRGPGGKPLPITKRKREQETRDADGDDDGDRRCLTKTAFVYLTVGLISSFVANGAVMASHALKSSKSSAGEDQWWCGEERIVSFFFFFFLFSPFR